MADAVVIGAGPNGLVAANLLADAGWDVLVLEAAPEPGGAARSGPLCGLPDFVHDHCSSFYPLAAASPVLAGLGLEAFGLRWRRSPLVLAHPGREASCPALSSDLEETAAGLDEDAPGDGGAWRELYALWRKIGSHLFGALFTPFPPVRAGARLAAVLGPSGLLDFVRLALLPVRRLGEERFSGRSGPLLLTGSALHTDLAPESAASALYGWLLCCLGQEVGFPVPEGGASSLVTALVGRLESRGGRVVCGAPVEQVVVRSRQAVGVRLAGGREEPARRAVLADVGAPALYRQLVAEHHLPARLLAAIDRFQYDHATVKVDWALDGPIPWTSEPARRAGTLHVADGLDHYTLASAQLATGRIPARPHLVMGQMGVADPTRSPPGTETAWAYTHVPQRIRGDAGGTLTGTWDEAETDAFAHRIEAEIEALAPGFSGLIRARHVSSPAALEAADANLVNGAVHGGTAQIHQQLYLRPTPGLGRPATPVRRLYLASASAHPGGGVHGAPGANAARVALAHDRRRRFMLGQ